MSIFSNGLIVTLVLCVVAVTVGVFYPLAVIWAINALFTTGIKYNFANWLAVVVLHIFFQGHSVFVSKK
jgi:hypothetical protein